MKNNKGFTIVELLVSLSLIIVVIIVLFEVIISLKELFQVSNIKTELLSKKSILVDKIETDIKSKYVSAVTQCGDYCISFVLTDGTTKQLEINKQDKTIKYANYIIDLDDNIYRIGNIYFSNDMTEYISNDVNNGILNIKIPIFSNQTGDENLGLNIVTTYNTNEISIGSFYIVDYTNNCDANEFCKDSRYYVGDQIKFGDYNWHIIDNQESSITLLMDASEISSRKHTQTGDLTYKWSTSQINNYLNNNFYNELLSKGIKQEKIITSNLGICDDETNRGGYPGYLSIDSINCNATYINSNIRMLSLSEYQNLKQYLENENIDSDFLYSETIGTWALMNGKGDANNILQVKADGTIVENAFSSYLNVRPVITISKK